MTYIGWLCPTVPTTFGVIKVGDLVLRCLGESACRAV